MRGATDTSSIHNCNSNSCPVGNNKTKTSSLHGSKHCAKMMKETFTGILGAWSSTVFWEHILIFINDSNAIGHWINGLRFCDHIEHAGTPSTQETSSIDIQILRDKLHSLLFHASTAQKLSQSLFLVTYRMFIYFSVFIRNATKAYAQSQRVV